MKRANPNNNIFCNPQLRDPLTFALSYMYDPSPFRGCCQFTLGVWEQAVDYEGELPCAFGRLSMTDPVPTVPLLTMKGLNGQVPVLVLRKIPQLFSLDHEAIGSANARSITITELPKLTKVGDCFLTNCTSLKQIEFKDLPGLTEVGSSWMDECTALQSMTISHLPKLNKVGSSFLRNCTSLKQVEFKDLPALTEVRDIWMTGCTALESMTISHLPKLNKVGSNFLRNCTLKHAELKIPANVASELVSRCAPLQQLQQKTGL